MKTTNQSLTFKDNMKYKDTERHLNAHTTLTLLKIHERNQENKDNVIYITKYTNNLSLPHEKNTTTKIKLNKHKKIMEMKYMTL